MHFHGVGVGVGVAGVTSADIKVAPPPPYNALAYAPVEIFDFYDTEGEVPSRFTLQPHDSEGSPFSPLFLLRSSFPIFSPSFLFIFPFLGGINLGAFVFGGAGGIPRGN